jgi:site-specific DNA-methyltransferase (adenine-specific)
MNSGLLTSTSDAWTTPLAFFYELRKIYDFEFDAACTKENCLCKKGFYFDQGMDALVEEWPKGPWIFCNPPYGTKIKHFVRKAFQQWQAGARIVMLIPSRTDTSWFHDYILGKARIQFIRGRLRFGDSQNSAPFPSMVVIYDHPERQ